MKKIYLLALIAWLIVFALLLLAQDSRAVGLKYVTPHTVTSDDMSSSGCTYVKVYWRVKGGVFTDANSVNAGKIWTTPYDLLNVIKVNGSYEIAGSCNDDKGNESDLSKNGTGTDGSVPFVYNALIAPTSFGTK